MKAHEIMTGDPVCVTADDCARRVAELMLKNDCGCLPVVERRDSRRVVGVITDRDIAVRAVARGKGVDTPVSDLMTRRPHCCTMDASLDEVARTMADRQVRRVVIVDDAERCVGIIAQADLARAAEDGRAVSDLEVARVVERISDPGPGSPRRAMQSAAAPVDYRF
jgi:CBS domain-containing protein